MLSFLFCSLSSSSSSLHSAKQFQHEPLFLPINWLCQWHPKPLLAKGGVMLLLRAQQSCWASPRSNWIKRMRWWMKRLIHSEGKTTPAYRHSSNNYELRYFKTCVSWAVLSVKKQQHSITWVGEVLVFRILVSILPLEKMLGCCCWFLFVGVFFGISFWYFQIFASVHTSAL